MTSITIVLDGEHWTEEGTENWIEALLDSEDFGHLKGEASHILINNKRCWSRGELTLKQHLEQKRELVDKSPDNPNRLIL